MLSSCKLATWNSYWKIVSACLMTCVLPLPPTKIILINSCEHFFFCSLQSHTGCKIHFRHESQRNVWAIITLHICGSFFQSSWEFQQSWTIRNKTNFSPQMTYDFVTRLQGLGSPASSLISLTRSLQNLPTLFFLKKGPLEAKIKHTLKTVMGIFMSSWCLTFY